MKTLLTFVIPIAFVAGSSALAQPNTGHEYSRTGNYKESVERKATGEQSRQHESASTRPSLEASHQYSRTGDYREPKVGQRNEQYDERTFVEFRDEQMKVVAPASAPNRFGTTMP